MHIRKPKQGIVFITSMIALVVMLIVGTSFMGLASQQLNSAQHELEQLHAVAMADGGINYAVAMQKGSGTQTSTIYTLAQMPADPHNLDPNGAIVPQFSKPTDTDNPDEHFAVWLSEFRMDGNQVGYQAISRGQYRKFSRLVRAVLQGDIPNAAHMTAPPQLAYSVFAKSNVTMGNSADVQGDLGSNGSLGLEFSGSGNVKGNVYTAGSISFKSLNGSIIPNVTFGTKVYDTNGNGNNDKQIKDVTDKAASYFPGSTVNANGKTLVVPTITVDDYRKWAVSIGDEAIWKDDVISSASSIRTPILYVPKSYLTNKDNAFSINTDILGYNPVGSEKKEPLTIFVDGNVEMEGNTTLGIAPESFTDANKNGAYDKAETYVDANNNGQYDEGETINDTNGNGKLDSAEIYVDANKNGQYDEGTPITLIATGSVTMKGTSEINGIVWAEGSFGGGEPTVRGAILCDNANYQGNCHFFHFSYGNALVVPPAITSEKWRIASWEVM